MLPVRPFAAPAQHDVTRSRQSQCSRRLVKAAEDEEEVPLIRGLGARGPQKPTRAPGHMSPPLRSPSAPFAFHRFAPHSRSFTAFADLGGTRSTHCPASPRLCAHKRRSEDFSEASTGVLRRAGLHTQMFRRMCSARQHKSLSAARRAGEIHLTCAESAIEHLGSGSWSSGRFRRFRPRAHERRYSAGRM